MMPFVAPSGLDPPLARDVVLMAWLGTVVESSEEEAAADALKELLGLKTAPRVLGCVETLPDGSADEDGTGGRVDLVFAIAAADGPTAAARRLRTTDVKWLSDLDKALYADDFWRAVSRWA